MYIKSFHFQLKPGQAENFLVLQKEIDDFYRKYVEYEIEFLQDNTNPNKWVEIQYYTSKQAYLDGQEKMNADSHDRPFWKKFHAMLDPQHSEVTEQEFEQPDK